MQMLARPAARNFAIAIGALLLAACGGGGGGGGLNSTPTPPPAPPPPPPPPPAGAWNDTSTSRTFTTLASHAVYSMPLGTENVTVVAAPATPSAVQVRYSTTDGAYLLTLPGYDESMVVDSGLISTATGLAIAPSATLHDLPDSFTYATLGSWHSREIEAGIETHKLGYFVFGTPTPTGGVPLTGSAVYTGVLAATTDRAFSRPSEDYITPVQIGGTVTLNFDFAAGTLGGQIRPELFCGNCFSMPLPSLDFTQTVFSAGSLTYSGKFDTALAGPNWFNGIFAGPGATETMAQFQAPFTDPNEMQQYLMSGVWVAQRP